MNATSMYRIQSYAVLTVIGIGYGFYSGWSQTSVTLSIIFGSLLVSEGFANYFAHIGQNSLKAIRRMTPSELEAHLETLAPDKRQRFVAHLLATGTADKQFVNGLTAEERAQYDALLEKLKHERGTGTT